MQNEPTAQASAPATTADDVPVDGTASQTLGTPQKDTVMADAPGDNLAVSLVMAEIQHLEILTMAVFSGPCCPSAQSRPRPYRDACARL